MVERKLQVEGEVIHVIVRACYNLSSFLRGLTATPGEALPLLTLSRPMKKLYQPGRIKIHPVNPNRRIFSMTEEILNK